MVPRPISASISYRPINIWELVVISCDWEKTLFRIVGLVFGGRFSTLRSHYLCNVARGERAEPWRLSAPIKVMPGRFLEWSYFCVFLSVFPTLRPRRYGLSAHKRLHIGRNEDASRVH